MSSASEKENRKLPGDGDGVKGLPKVFETPKLRSVGPRSGARASATSRDGSHHRGGPTLRRRCLSPLGTVVQPQAPIGLASGTPTGTPSRPRNPSASPRVVAPRRQPARRAKSESEGSSILPLLVSSPPAPSTTPARVRTRSSATATKTDRSKQAAKPREKETTPSPKVSPESRSKGSGSGARRSSRSERTSTEHPSRRTNGSKAAAPASTIAGRTRRRKSSGVSVFSVAEAGGSEYDFRSEEDEGAIDGAGARKGPADAGRSSKRQRSREPPGRTPDRLMRRRQAGTPRGNETQASSRNKPASTKRDSLESNSSDQDVDEAPGAMTRSPVSISPRSAARGSHRPITYVDSDEDSGGKDGTVYEPGSWRLSDDDHESEDARGSAGKGKFWSPRRVSSSRRTARASRGTQGAGVAAEAGDGETTEPGSLPLPARTPAPASASSSKRPGSDRHSGTTLGEKHRKMLEDLKAHFNKVDSHELRLSRY